MCNIYRERHNTCVTFTGNEWHMCNIYREWNNTSVILTGNEIIQV
jgi:hypothetical protein